MPGLSEVSFTENQREIIKALLYFDVFQYPLTRAELRENCAVAISETQFNEELDILLHGGALIESEGFILHPEAPHSAIQKRKEGNKGALDILPLAYKYSQQIASFPFVEGVCLSGSLSKKYFDEKSDIDYFIITKPNRLWICRTLLILKYKSLPKHKKKYWCTNYFISCDVLAIPDVNSFTATELAHLIPAVNYESYAGLLNENPWSGERFPNKARAAATHCQLRNRPSLTSFIEFILSGFIGNWIDSILLFVTLRHWKKKYPELEEADFDLQFRSRKTVCKRHNKGYQNKILKLWEEKLKQYENSYRPIS
ncbi:MAG: nucleotidyltransferase domain-containing protein [bacterium]|nr:nucleotidyltransferase domain-containing protein [bacterium]